MDDNTSCKVDLPDGYISDQNVKTVTLYRPTQNIVCTPVINPFSESTSTLPEANEKTRTTWSRQLDFFLSCVGYAVGLGNIWRFPYLCYSSGGGAFFIPYFLFLIICGVPLFYLEMSLGQFGSLGPIAIWKISPFFKGLGYAMAFVSTMVSIYYNGIIAWTLYYIYQSYNLSWSTCDNSWNTPNCISSDIGKFDFPLNASKVHMAEKNTSEGFDSLVSNVTANSSHRLMSASEEFWLFNVLSQTSGIDTAGEFQGHLVLSLFIAWILIFVLTLKGVKSIGKVVYVTAVFPYFVLFGLLIRAVTLPGAYEGIIFYLSPKFDKLLSFKVWGDAATQIFYSVGAGWGALLTMSSYNKFNHNVYRDSIAVPIINCITSILAGFVVFSVIGYMAHESGKEIKDVVSEGPGLVFVVYPQALALLPIPSLWSILFFIMLLTVGLDTQFSMFETAISAFVDEFPNLIGKRKKSFALLLCMVLFVLGLPCVTQGGIYVVELMNWYSAAFALMVISLLEVIAIAWIYGVDRFCLDIFLMTNRMPSFYWKCCWCCVTPLTILGLLFFLIITHSPIVYNKYEYPAWSVTIGWILAIFPISPIVINALYQLFHAEGSIKERFIKSLLPLEDWGPALEENKIKYRKSLNTVPIKLYKSSNAIPMVPVM